MNGLLSRSGMVNGVLALLMACALASRLMVPAGFMPVPGAAAITICTGTGAETRFVDREGKPVAPDDREVRSTCAFAAPAASDAVLARIAPVAAPALAQAAFAPLPAAALAVPRTSPRPPGQAPPFAA